jgi:hypothetical protein
VRKVTFCARSFQYFALTERRCIGAGESQGNAVLKSSFTGLGAAPTRLDLVLALGLVLAMLATGSVSGEPGTAEQRRACTPDVYRLCAGEIPNVRAITACLRRQKASLSEACRAVFQQ